MSRFRTGLYVFFVATSTVMLAHFGRQFEVRFDPAIADIPAGFDFPNPRIATPPPRSPEDYKRIRRHAWMVWAGMTQRTGNSTLPVWASWPDAIQVFDHSRNDLRPSGGIGGLQKGSQFEFFLPTPPDSRPIEPRNISICQMSPLVSVLYNRAAARHIRDAGLQCTKTLSRMMGSVPLFPSKAVAVKAMWWPIRNDKQFSAVPVWNGELRYPPQSGAPAPNSCGNGPMTWRDVVAVDVNRNEIPNDEKIDIDFADPESDTGRRKCRQVSVVPLSSMYSVPAASVKLTNEQIGLVNDLTNKYWPPGVLFDREKDFLVLVGLHFATREIENWFWATVWWHNWPEKGDTLDEKPENVESPWSNYRMDCAVDADEIVFNPYLESRFSNGTTSNCLACHQRAALALGDRRPESFHTERGAIKTNDEYFSDKLRTQFLWSIPILAN